MNSCTETGVSKWSQNVSKPGFWDRGIHRWAFPDFWSGTGFPGLASLKGPGWGFGPEPSRDTFLRVQKWSKVLPKGAGWEFGRQLSRDRKVVKIVIFDLRTSKIGTYSQ